MDLNHRQADYDSAALPTELHSRKNEVQKIVKPTFVGKAISYSFFIAKLYLDYPLPKTSVITAFPFKMRRFTQQLVARVVRFYRLSGTRPFAGLLFLPFAMMYNFFR